MHSSVWARRAKPAVWPGMLLLLFHFGCMPLGDERAGPTARDGIAMRDGMLDLRQRPLTRMVVLDGDWEFFPSQFVDPAGAKSRAGERFPASGSIPLSLPGYWNEAMVDGRPFGARGFGSYRMLLHLDPADVGQPLALYVPHAFTAYRLFVDGRALSENGEPGTTEEVTVEQFLPRMAAFQPERERVEILIHVANFRSARGGFRQSIELGTADAIAREKQLRLMTDLFLAGSILAISLYHLALFGHRPKERYALFFSMYTALLVVYELTTGEYALMLLFPEFSWVWMARAFLLSIYLSTPFLCMFLDDLFPAESWPRWSRLLQGLFGILAASVFLPVPGLAEKTLTVAEGLLVLVGLYGLLVLVRSVWRGREGARILLAGFVAFFAAILNDILFELDLLQTEVYAPAGLLVLVSSQSLVLLRRFTYLFQAVEKEHALLKRSVSLRERVYRLLLRSRRLELELLKKTIQPHFLMNTLAAIRAWLLESPERSGYLLDELTDELRGMLSMARKQQVPIHEEIGLCLHHLRVMETRREKSYRLRIRGIDGTETVPPLLFHTIMENGFSHLDSPEARLRFLLLKERRIDPVSSDEISEYTFAARTSGTAMTGGDDSGTGTGMRYVRYRLEESYPGRWRLRHGPCKGGYTVTISIQRESHQRDSHQRESHAHSDR